MSTEPEKERNFLIFGLVVVSIIGAFVVLGYFAYEPARVPGYRSMCINNQRQVVLALHNYESFQARFPPVYVKDKNGRPLYSWRVLLLQHLGRSDLFDEFHWDEPWDSPHNQKITDVDIEIFRCPRCESEVSGRTSYVLVTGPGTVWDGDKPRALEGIRYPEQTLIMIEVADSDIHWAEPKDLRIDAIDPSFLDEEGKLKSNHSGGAVGTFADGHTEFISEEDIPKALQEWSQVKQEKWEREK